VPSSCCRDSPKRLEQASNSTTTMIGKFHMSKSSKQKSIIRLEDIPTELLLHRDGHTLEFVGDTCFDSGGTMIKSPRKSRKRIHHVVRLRKCSCGYRSNVTILCSTGEIIHRSTSTPKNYRTQGIGRTLKQEARQVYFNKLFR
jgi:hypothetical protein